MDFPKISQEQWREVIDMLFKNWNPFPDREYCERHGIPITEDGKIVLSTLSGRHIEYEI